MAVSNKDGSWRFWKKHLSIASYPSFSPLSICNYPFNYSIGGARLPLILVEFQTVSSNLPVQNGILDLLFRLLFSILALLLTYESSIYSENGT